MLPIINTQYIPVIMQSSSNLVPVTVYEYNHSGEVVDGMRHVTVKTRKAFVNMSYVMSVETATIRETKYYYREVSRHEKHNVIIDNKHGQSNRYFANNGEETIRSYEVMRLRPMRYHGHTIELPFEYVTFDNVTTK